MIGGGNILPDKLFANDARLAAAANHAEEDKRLANPFGKHQGIVLMTARDDQAEGG